MATIGGAVPFGVQFDGFLGNLSANLQVPARPALGSCNLSAYIPDNPYPEQTLEDIENEIKEKYLTPRLDHAVADDVHEVGKIWEIDDRHGVDVGPEVTEPTLSLEPTWSYSLDLRKVLEGGGLLADEELPLDDHLLLRNKTAVMHEVEEVEAPARTAADIAGPSHELEGTWLEDLMAGRLKSFAPDMSHGLIFPTLQGGAPYVVEAPPMVAGTVSQQQPPAILNFNDLFKNAWEKEEEERGGGLEPEESEAKTETQTMATATTTEPTDGVPTSDKGGTAAADQGERETEEDPARAHQRQVELALERLLSDPAPWWSDKGRKGVAAGWKRPGAASASKEFAVVETLDKVDEQFAQIRNNLAMEFPFELDGFQKQAIYHLERGESVFVAAHTSAGKTVVAEYAFALAAQHCTRAVYTSPIKAISNQKFRDFSRAFDVGLMTGDVSIRPEARGLIMTTEILRSMLYKGSDTVRDIEWVIFDEVHYVNDAERGVVWEEAIIMLPPHVNLVLLSATVPNIEEFADWIGRTKNQKVYVTGTTRRPVPLEHCLWYSGDLYKVCEHETFLPQGMKAAHAALKEKTAPKGGGGGGARGPSQGAARGRGGGGGGSGRGGTGHGSAAARTVSQSTGGAGGGGGWRGEASQWHSLVNYLNKKGLLPSVIFCFSKNRCDQAADGMGNADLTSGAEKSEIVVFCKKAFSRLKGSDQRLPQVLRITDLLKRGIGCHHAGLLPIVKEVVEMLFCRGVIKILFSTETFAMGVNAPARSVAFHSLRKHDGKTFRQLYPGEYTQMAGRAGRRGLDQVGTVIIMCWDEVPEEGDIRRLLTGKPTKLESKFRLTYNMILNVLHKEDLKVEDMLKNSFAEFHAQRMLPEQQMQLQEGEAALQEMTVGNIDCIFGVPTIREYAELAYDAHDSLGKELQSTILQSRAGLQSLTVGRAVLARLSKDFAPSLAAILRPPSADATSSLKSPCTVLVLHPPRDAAALLAAKQSASSAPSAPPKQLADGAVIIRSRADRSLESEYSVGLSGKKGLGRTGGREGGAQQQLRLPHYGEAEGLDYGIVDVPLADILSIYNLKVQVDRASILENGDTGSVKPTLLQLRALRSTHPTGLPLLDPVKDLKLADVDLVEKYRKRVSLLSTLALNKCHDCPKLQEHYSLVRREQRLRDRVRDLKFQVSDAALQQMPEFNTRVEILQALDYVDEAGVVQVKGRVARYMNSGDELISTEALFDNHLDDLAAEEAVALLSALVFQQKDASEPDLTPTLDAARQRLTAMALRLGDLQVKRGLPMSADEYVSNALNFRLMQVVYEWAKGTEFADICELTNVPEGSIVRTIVRLHETCKDFMNAALIVGDSILFEKMKTATAAIKRDIVFAASLYVSGPDSA